MIELDEEVQFAARKLGLEWAEKTAKEGKHKHFAEVHKSQLEFDEGLARRGFLAQGESQEG
jgi:hypothetical protein